VIGPTEWSTTSFAVVNPGPVDAPVTFTLFRSSGEVVADSVRIVPSGGQLARLASEIFPNVAVSGWVQATSAVPIRGFWLAGDFATFTDGAEAIVAAPSLVLPLITDLTEVTLVNTGTTPTAVLIRLYGRQGQELVEPAVRLLPPKGCFRGQSTEIFSLLDWSEATHAAVTSATPVAGSVTLRDFRNLPFISAANAVDKTTSVSELVFPHVVHGPAGTNNYTTMVSVINLRPSSQNIRLTFTPEDGGRPQSVERTLPGNAGLRINAQTLFDFPDAFQNGWVRVTGAQGLAGLVSITDAGRGGGTIVAGISRADSSFIFGHIADLPPWSTGLAMVNSGQLPAAVEIFAIASDGMTIGSASIAIPPNGKSSGLLRDWIPQTQTRTSDGGFVFVRSTTPLYGISIFFSRNLSILANIPSLQIPTSIVFNPRQ
jgi:hypothetical protein